MKTALYVIAGLALVLFVTAAATTPAFGQSPTTPVAAPSASPVTTLTPDKFKPLLGTWEYLDNPKYHSTFKIHSVNESGTASITYTGRSGQIAATCEVVEDPDGTLRLKIEGGNISRIVWDLQYAKGSRVLTGTVKPAQARPSDVRLWRAEK